MQTKTSALTSLTAKLSIRSRHVGAMAIGTLISRMTGLFRLSVIAWSLGISTLSDIFNLSNNAPNTFFDLLIGGVLASTITPVMVASTSRTSRREARRALSAITTITTLALIIASILFELLAPVIMRAYFISNHQPTRDLQLQAATNLLRFFAPQLFFYGVISIATSLLNTKRHFKVPAFAPIANNAAAILTLVIFHFSYAHLTELQRVSGLAHASTPLIVLGVGTTAGVAIQCLVVIVAVLKSNISLSFVFDIRHSAVREIFRLSGWSFGYVVTNQIALYVVLALAEGHEAGAVSAYNNSYLFFQLPYGIAAFSVMAAIIPDLSEYHTHGERSNFVSTLTRGLRVSVASLIPFTALYLTTAPALITLLLGHGAATQVGINQTARSLEALGLGLVPFGTFLALVQGLQAARAAKEVFFIYLVENTVNVALALLLVRSLGVFGLSLSVTIAYMVGTLVALGFMTRRNIRPRLMATILSWTKIGVASVAMGLGILFTSHKIPISRGLNEIVYIGIELLIGGALFVGVLLGSYGLSVTLKGKRQNV